MKLEQYISQLLYRYQCVTVPGFGAFLTETQSARIHEGTSAFYPPRKVVVFNSLIKNNDGLLANHIATSLGLSYEQTVDLLNKEVSRWKAVLEQKEIIRLDSVGEFSLNSENNIVFTPNDQVNYLKESFGLSSFVSPSIKREVKNYISQEVIDNSVEENLTTTTEYVSEEISETEIKIIPIARKRNYNFFKYASVIVITLGIAGYAGNEFYKKEVEAQTLLVEKAVQEKVHQKIQEATFVIENPLTSVTLNVKEEKLQYHVVAGAFKDEANAQKAFEQLSEKGYKSRKLDKNKYGLYPVLYGSFETYEKAQELMKNIQKENKDAWILVQEL